MKKNITIIGGSDGFGKWLASFITKSFTKNINLTITGRDIEKLEKLSSELSCNYETDNIKSVTEADVVIFAVPIGFMVETIKQVGPYIKKGAMALDVTSIKDSPSKALIKYCKKGVLVLPTHPMFGPYISTIAGQIFVLCPEKKDKSDPRYIFLKNFLEENDAKVIEETPKNHDKMMAVVQGLTHFDMFVFGETIRRLKLDLKKSMDFVSPIYKIMISSVARYLNQNPKLYSDIQIYNKEVLKVHKTFMKTTNDFNKIVKDKNEKKFIKTATKTKNYFGDDANEGQEYTDKIIYMIGRQSELAHKKTGKIVSIENIYTREKVRGLLEKVENETLFINGESYKINNWNIN